MGISAQAALWFAVFIVPISVLVAYNDLSRMKIPNVLVGAMVVVYAVVGLMVLPVDAYMWGYAHLVVMLVVGMVLNAIGAMGAGDAKYIAAAAPFVHLADLRLVLVIFLASLLAAFITHRMAKVMGAAKALPNWQSWHTGKRFPMGLALGMTMIFYLLLGVYAGGDVVT